MSIRNDYRRQLDGVFFSEDFEQRAAKKMREAADAAENEPERKGINVDFSSRKLVKLVAAVAAAAVLLTGTVFAADAIIERLTPAQVAEHVGIEELKIAFSSPDAVMIDQSIESNGWRITLMGITNAEEMAEKFPAFNEKKDNYPQNGELDPSGQYVMLTFDDIIEDALGSERMYVAAAIERLDGTPLTEDSDMPMLEAIIDGYTPSKVNSWTLGFTSERFVQNGTAYYLFDMANMSAFADHTIRLAAYDGMIPDENVFAKADDGSAGYAAGYTGTKALFTLPVKDDGRDHSEAKNLADLFESIDMQYQFINSEK